MAQQLARGNVDAGEQRIARPQRALPGAELPRGALENEQAKLDDEPGLFGDGDEFIGRHPPQSRVVPARQRLEAGDGAVLKPHDRLIEDRYLFALERPPQIGFDRQPIRFARPHRRLEHFDPIATHALGVIHGELGVLQSFLGALRLGIAECQSDRAGQKDLAIVEGDRGA